MWTEALWFLQQTFFLKKVDNTYAFTASTRLFIKDHTRDFVCFTPSLLTIFQSTPLLFFVWFYKGLFFYPPGSWWFPLISLGLGNQLQVKHKTCFRQVINQSERKFFRLCFNLIIIVCGISEKVREMWKQQRVLTDWCHLPLKRQ